MIYFDNRNKPMCYQEFPIGTLQISRAMLLNNQRGYVWRPVIIDECMFIYIKSGMAEFSVSGRRVTVPAGHAVVFARYAKISGAAVGEAPCSFWCVYFSTTCEEIFRPFLTPMQINNSPSIRSAAELLASNIGFPKRRKIHESLLLTIFELAKISPPDRSPEARLAGRVREYVMENMDGPLTAESVSAAVHYHKDYLCRVMHAYTEKTLKQYINELRIEKAKALLATSSYPIAEIAKSVGFDNANNFTKFFKYHTGLTPSDYKKN